jgi:nucleoside-diphosphate-sugar epimerase
MGGNERILVAGGGGFIGGHIVSNLRARGHTNVRAVDSKPLDQWHQTFPEVDNRSLDLRELASCREAVCECVAVYNFASDMGGMGFIATNKARCMLSVLINTHLLVASREVGVKRFFFASSACVYAGYRQSHVGNESLREEDAYPADPEDGYGWEKLFSERMCKHFWEDFGLETRVARLHNVYGPYGAFDGGREKAPAAICRKILEARRDGSGTIEVWGDGKQTRSFMYIDDCVEGIRRLMASDVRVPVNLGSAEVVSIAELVDIVEALGDGTPLQRRFDLEKPMGVRARSSDNTLAERVLGWSPRVPLREGLKKTYGWIGQELQAVAGP